MKSENHHYRRALGWISVVANVARISYTIYIYWYLQMYDIIFGVQPLEIMISIVTGSSRTRDGKQNVSQINLHKINGFDWF